MGSGWGIVDLGLSLSLSLGQVTGVRNQVAAFFSSLSDCGKVVSLF